MVTRSFTIYKGYRIHLLEEPDFRRDAKGRYVVSVHIEKPQLDSTNHIEIPDCFASSLEEAQQVSVEQAMRIIDGRLDAKGNQHPASRKRAVKRGGRGGK